jgi:hypothetical protein
MVVPVALRKLHEPADRHGGDTIIRALVFEPEQARPEAERKTQARDAKGPRHQQVPRLMNEDEQIHRQNCLEKMD